MEQNIGLIFIDCQKEESNLEFRLSSVENVLAKNIKNQQNASSENLKISIENLIDRHSNALQSTQTRLGDLTDAIQGLLQASVPLERRFGRKDDYSTPWDIGDTTQFFINKT